jgi:hypothetical protein
MGLSMRVRVGVWKRISFLGYKCWAYWFGPVKEAEGSYRFSIDSGIIGNMILAA